ncbi:hypothetical protein V1505DRAFT_380533 [Lipomyces doorenjongii]
MQMISVRLISSWGHAKIFRRANSVLFTTGLSPTTFDYGLDCGLRDEWNTALIMLRDVCIHCGVRSSQTSLDADGWRIRTGLQILNSSIAQFALQELFEIVPSVCSRYF